jgi:periplasmic protein TonB
MMNNKIPVLFAISMLASCTSHTSIKSVDEKNEARKETRYEAAPSATTLEEYKRDLAQCIVRANPGKVSEGRPQALLRSVIVVKYVVDSRGNLTHSEIMRSNHDGAAEMAALTALKSAAPFPKPAPHLLRRGRVEIMETWLFNNDGRFQLRTIAEPQMDQ